MFSGFAVENVASYFVGSVDLNCHVVCLFRVVSVPVGMMNQAGLLLCFSEDLKFSPTAVGAEELECVHIGKVSLGNDVPLES